ncbi:MAG: hypothetical protein J7L82_00360 [Staphylothermus sp.]|nr:hypothetical protein [Staphylothermus sp.]
MNENKTRKEPKYKVSERIDEYSRIFGSKDFSTRIMQEGIFRGVTRIVGVDLNKFFDELISSSANTCMYYLINLQRKTGQWDEVILNMCGDEIYGIYGVFLDKKVLGREAYSVLIDSIKRNMYKVGIIEAIELGKELGRRKAVKNKMRKISHESTKIHVQETQTRDNDEAQRLISEKRTSIHEAKRAVNKRARGKKAILVKDALRYDRLIFKFNTVIAEYMKQYGITISKIIVKGDDKNLDVVIYVTKLRNVYRKDLSKYANDIAKIIVDTVREEALKINHITVTLTHGLYTIKFSKTLQ